MVRIGSFLPSSSVSMQSFDEKFYFYTWMTGPSIKNEKNTKLLLELEKAGFQIEEKKRIHSETDGNHWPRLSKPGLKNGCGYSKISSDFSRTNVRVAYSLEDYLEDLQRFHNRSLEINDVSGPIFSSSSQQSASPFKFDARDDSPQKSLDKQFQESIFCN